MCNAIHSLIYSIFVRIVPHAHTTNMTFYIENIGWYGVCMVRLSHSVLRVSSYVLYVIYSLLHASLDFQSSLLETQRCVLSTNVSSIQVAARPHCKVQRVFCHWAFSKFFYISYLFFHVKKFQTKKKIIIKYLKIKK